MSLRSTALTVVGCVASALLALILLVAGAVYTAASPHLLQQLRSNGHSSTTHASLVLAGVLLLIAAVLCGLASARMAMAGLTVEGDTVTVRTVGGTERYAVAELAGLALQPLLRRRLFRVVVVRRGGDVVPSPWSVVRSPAALQGRLHELTALGAAAGAAASTQELREHRRLADAAPSMTGLAGTVWNSPPGWPVPPPGWTPSPGWMPQPGWPPAPADWQWWRIVAVPLATPEPLIGRDSAPVVEEQSSRRWLRTETVVVMVAFLVPALAGAIGALLTSVGSSKSLNEFALPVHGKFTLSLVILIISYVATAATVPLALVLLARTGQSPAALGLSLRKLRQDVLPALGINVLVLISLAVLSFVLLRFIDGSSAANNPHDSYVPYTFILYGFAVSLTTAINEEVFVNGYLLTRLSQLGWRPWPAFALSLALRTSYHLYYGVALLGTIPFGYFVTRSFQKHRRLGRAIIAHFVNDFVLFTITIASLHHH